MNETSEQDFGYDYTIALCEAIEKAVEAEKTSNPGTFNYKGGDLRYAMERALYFTYANHNHLLGLFGQHKSRALKEVEAKDDVEKGLIVAMSNIDPETISYRQKPKENLKQILRFVLITFGIDKLVEYFRKRENEVVQRNLKYEVLFYVINERFVRFMKPIFDKIPVPCAYITTSKDTAKYLEEEKIPYVKVSHFGYALTRLSQKYSWIKRFSLTEYYDLLEDSIKRIHPKSVVFVEGNASSYEVVNRICKKFSIESICLQQGWSPIIHNGFRNMSYSKMLLWGDGFAKDLAPYNPKQKFITTGSQIIEKIDKLKTAKRAGDKIKLGFLPPMHTKILNQKRLDEFMSLVPWTANEFKNAEIRISLHPKVSNSELKEKLSAYSNVTFLSTRDNTLQDIIGGNDIVISFFSSTILESIAAGALPLMVNLTRMPHYFPDIDKIGAGIEVRSLEQAKDVLRDLVSHPEKISSFDNSMKKFREEYFANNKEAAMKNIIKEII